jgi:hypothetical protein
MTDFPRGERLLNHPQVGSGVGQGGCCATLFGLPFLGAGLLVLAVAHGDVQGEKNAPDWIIGVFGAVFALAGSFMIILGLQAWRGEQRRKLALEAAPDEPWRERAWDEREAHDRSTGPLAMFAVAAFMTLFLSMFNYFTFVDPKASAEAPCFAKGIVVLFDLVCLALWGNAFYLLGRRLKYGRAAVRFSTFPLVVDQPLRVTLELPPAHTGFETIKATLRCAEQVWETSGSGKNSKRQLVTYELWREERSLPADEVGRDATFSFTLPPGAPSTAIHGTPSRFWELQLDAETPGIDYHGLFLLPVYAMPGKR